MQSQFKPKNLLYALTGYSAFQFLGFIGTAYPFFTQTSLIILVFTCLIILGFGILDATAKQNKQHQKLSNAQVQASLIPSGVLIVLVIVVTLIGGWIAL